MTWMSPTSPVDWLWSVLAANGSEKRGVCATEAEARAAITKAVADFAPQASTYSLMAPTEAWSCPFCLEHHAPGVPCSLKRFP
jgi:hypothetical protein